MSFTSQLQAIATAATQRPYNPWQEKLSRIKGRRASDGVERITTQAICDFLEIHMAQRQGASRRISIIMQKLGWSPIRMRGVTPGGFRDQIRGYARQFKE